MTPKEKAKELAHKMWVYAIINKNGSWNNAKQCALIAVDEIIKLVSDDLDLYYKDCIYWEEVKTELTKP
jgi:hypothetical protein